MNIIMSILHIYCDSASVCSWSYFSQLPLAQCESKYFFVNVSGELLCSVKSLIKLLGPTTNNRISHVSETKLFEILACIDGKPQIVLVAQSNEQ